MSSNSSVVLDAWCRSILTYSHISVSAYQTILAACIVTFLLAPMTMVGNALVLAAIWRNPSLRTPSYVLLAGLAFTDFCTGLLSLPFFAMSKLAELRGSNMICTFALLSLSVSMFFSCLTVFTIAITAVERWLYMSRRSLLTVRRIVIIYTILMLVTTAFVAVGVNSVRYSLEGIKNVLIGHFLTAAAICVLVTAFSYFKVFRIIRNHQVGVQANQNAIDILKYRKSIVTILYILALLLLSYFPYLCCALIFHMLQDYGESFLTTTNSSAVVVFLPPFPIPCFIAGG